MTSAEQDWRPGTTHQREIAIAIPVISFLGLGIAISLQAAGIVPDAAELWYGPAIGAFLLGYLAWIKPRFDIVAICAPIYALLILVFPLETKPSLLLEILFAISITILTVRLERRFSTPRSTVEDDPMERYLYDYMERLRAMYRDIDPKTAHQIAQVFLSFKYGLYGNVVKESDEAISLLKGNEAQNVLSKGLSILRERSKRLENADVAPVTHITFNEEDAAYLAIQLPPEANEDPATLQLNNAIILVYSVSFLTSEDDEQTLDEHEKYIVGLISSYRKALGL